MRKDRTTFGFPVCQHVCFVFGEKTRKKWTRFRLYWSRMEGSRFLPQLPDVRGPVINGPEGKWAPRLRKENLRFTTYRVALETWLLPRRCDFYDRNRWKWPLQLFFSMGTSSMPHEVLKSKNDYYGTESEDDLEFCGVKIVQNPKRLPFRWNFSILCIFWKTKFEVILK